MAVFDAFLIVIFSGNGSIDVYRYQDKQVLAYYATLPSKRLYERLLNTEVGVYGWKWKCRKLEGSDRERLVIQMEGLAEGECLRRAFLSLESTGPE